MSLKDAREARDDARKLLRTVTDPTQKRQLDKLTRQAVAGITFEVVARELHATKHSGWSPRYAARWLRGWGIEAEASSQATRGVSRRSLRGWERQPGASARANKRRGEHKSGPAFRATRSSALQAWAEITKALAASPDPADRQLSKSIVDFVMQTDDARAVQRHRAAQRQAELPGMNMGRGRAIQRVSPERSRGPDMSR